MEEILASIRQIINQNDAPADTAATESLSLPAASDADAIDNAPEDDDILELTTILEEDEAPASSAVEPAALEPMTATPLPMTAQPAPTPDPFALAPEATVAPQPIVEQVLVAQPATAGTAQELITGITAAAATAALNNLAATLQHERAEHSLPFGNASRTLESMVVEAIKPLLKDWLDQHLAGIVERVVQAEVEKLTRRVGG